MKKYVSLLFCLNIIILSSCEKDIDIDYHQVPSLYVVEASVSNTSMEARISRTQNMDDNSTQSDISNARVMVPTINSFRVVRKKIATEWFQIGELKFPDLPNEDNWYFMHIYRNDLGYRWAVLDDRNDPNNERQQLFTFFREGEGGSDVLRDGDDLRIELYTIDKRAYDYLFSMQMMENTGTNQIPNFTGGCLGFFSAHWLVAIPFTYRAADVEIEE